MPYQNSFTTFINFSTNSFIKENSKKIQHQPFNNQLIKLSSSSEIDNIIQEGEVIFKKNPTVSLREVSKLVDSAIIKRQGDQRKHSFLEKKILHNRENGFTMKHPKTSHQLIDCAMKQSTHHFHHFLFYISKYLAYNAEKTSQLKITKKECI